jgi:tRNA modification GTPase
MGKSQNDAIVGIATPPGPAERAVIRVSGPNLLPLMSASFPSLMENISSSRGSHRRTSRRWGKMWLLFFPAPNSFTGEDVLELHLPSSRPLLDDFLKRFQAGDFRLAEPGEFSRRAFLNGRLDLTQAEGILDLVQSRTVAQAQAATKALAGDLGNHVQVACDLLFDAMVQVEASLDFEEGDSQDLRPGEIYALLESAEKSLRDGETFQKQHLVQLSDEWTIVLAGAPNAGKTTLFQTLTKKEGLVSPQPGTTRDARRGLWPSASDGLPWVLVDGPGLGGAVVDERDFLARKRFEADKFDMLWWVVDRSKPDRASLC